MALFHVMEQRWNMRFNSVLASRTEIITPLLLLHHRAMKKIFISVPYDLGDFAPSRFPRFVLSVWRLGPNTEEPLWALKNGSTVSGDREGRQRSREKGASLTQKAVISLAGAGPAK